MRVEAASRARSWRIRLCGDGDFHVKHMSVRYSSLFFISDNDSREHLEAIK